MGRGIEGGQQFGLDLREPEDQGPPRAEKPASPEQAAALRLADAQRFLRESGLFPLSEIVGAEHARPESVGASNNEVVFATEKTAFVVRFDKDGRPVDARRIELEN